MPRVELFFDFLSPYAYLAWKTLPSHLPEDVEVAPKPVLLAALLEHGGQLGPAEVPAKRSWLIRDVARQAIKNGLPLTFPATHPFRPLTALRASTEAAAGGRQWEVIDRLFEHGWAEGGELGHDNAVAAALDRGGLDGAGLIERARTTEVKDALRANTDEAIAGGVFGVPTLRADDELFWGSDRIDDLRAHLRGELRLDPAAIARAEGVPAGARRRGLPPSNGGQPE